MWLWLYVLVVPLVVAGWVYRRWLRVSRYWRERGVPHRSPSPLLGSLTFLQRENVAIWLKNLYQEISAPYVGIWMFWKPALVINDPELCRQIISKDSGNFRNRFVSSGKSDPIGALNIFTANDPLWSQVRRRLTPMFTSAKLKANETLLRTKTNNLIERLRSEIKMGTEIDIRTILSDFTTDVIGESAYGVASDSVVTGTSVMREVTKDFMKYSTWRGLGLNAIFFLPSIVDTFGFSFFSKFSNNLITSVFKKVVAQRGGYARPVTECHDLLDLLLKFKQDAAKDNEDISEEVLLAQAAIFLQGGFDTSSVSLTRCLYHLAYDPDLQERLYREILETEKKFENNELTGSILNEMPYLNAVLKETLRLHPPMSWIDRVAQFDYRLTDELTIPAGMPVLANVVGMHYDPKYFPDPERFDPDRFMPENEGNIVPYTYLPFGDGPRACIGRRFAFQTMHRGLYQIARNFKFKPLPNYPKPSDVEIEKKAIFEMPAQKLSFEFVPRQS